MLQLKLFGNFEICGAPEPAVLSSAKHRGLLAYLALSQPKGETRDRIIALLWGSRFEKQAHQSFRQCLARLRKILGPETILFSEQIVMLSPTRISSDVSLFESLIRKGSKEALREAVGLVDGELLAGIDIREPAWEEWLSGERRRVEIAVIDASLALGEIEYREGDAVAALRLGEAATRLDFLREDAHRLTMRALAKLGRRSEALIHYKNLVDRLKVELGTTAEAATENCYENIRKGLSDRPAKLDSSVTVGRLDQDLTAHRSIAVLPFTNLSKDPEHEFFVQGLTDDLITDLSQLGDLVILARDSSGNYKGNAADTSAIAHALGVRFVLAGSARQSDERIRINVHLTDTSTGRILWAERFDRRLDDAFACQDELVSRINEAVAGRLMRDARHECKRTTIVEAYDLCARGRELVLQSPAATREARILFERAIVIDPRFSEAYRWLALSYDLAWVFGGEPEQPHHTLAVASAKKAVALDPDDAAAHAMLATVLEPSRRWEEAEAEFTTAVRLDPHDANSWALLSEFLVLKGQPASALDAIEKALRLNPHPPGWYLWFLGQAQYLGGRYELAVRTLRKEATYRTQSRRTLAASLAQLGLLDEARQEARLFMANHPNFTIGHWSYSVPFESRSAGEHFVDGYRRAGLPE